MSEDVLAVQIALSYLAGINKDKIIHGSGKFLEILFMSQAVKKILRYDVIRKPIEYIFSSIVVIVVFVFVLAQLARLPNFENAKVIYQSNEITGLVVIMVTYTSSSSIHGLYSEIKQEVSDTISNRIDEKIETPESIKNSLFDSMIIFSLMTYPIFISPYYKLPSVFLFDFYTVYIITGVIFISLLITRSADKRKFNASPTQRPESPDQRDDDTDRDREVCESE
jgi:hypothetical protein